MYTKNMKKEESKRIFRPWDQEQDATVSTTFTEDTKPEPIPIATQNASLSNSETISKPKSEPSERVIKTCDKKQRHISPPPPFNDYLLDSYQMYSPEILNSQMIPGVTMGDPALMDAMAQGYALEEYARVLSQEHQAKLLNSRKQRPKKYKCPHCNVGFSNNGQLKGHIRIHTGERPFKCDEKDCGKTFTRNEELTRHKRIHSGLRPYPCTHCGKRFGRKDHLKKHSRTHFQPRGLYAVPVMLPYETWANPNIAGYPIVPMYGF